MKLPTTIIMLLVAGCTSYQPRGVTGGFSETQMSPTLYQVRFVGNGYTSEERATEFFLRRCAEIALENGFRYFVITDERGTTPNFWDSSRVRGGTLRLLELSETNAADAVVVVKQTDARAGGKLSMKATETLKRLDLHQ